MNNEIKVFDNLKVKEENGQVLFDAETAAIGLGISTVAKSGNAVARWARVNKYLGIATSGDGVKRGDFITEPQFYKLAIKANNETAENFQDWVTSEVLPAIRKTGSYSIKQDSYLIEDPIKRAEKWIIEAKERQELKSDNLLLNQQINEFKPKIDFVDVVLKSKSLVSTSIISKDYGMSATEMNKLLHELGVQYRQGETWLLYAPHQRKGWTQTQTFSFKHKDGTSDMKPNTKWTQKGRLGIYELLKSHNILPMIERES